MDIDDRINQIIADQNNPPYHPLTCGNDSRHTPLVPIKRNDEIILICVDCVYTQKYLPPPNLHIK